MIRTILTLLTMFSIVLFSTVEAMADSNKQQLEPVTLQLKWLHQFQFAGYYAALEQGYYADEGLYVTIKPLDDDYDVVTQVLTGEADYAVDDIGILASYAEGAPIKALAAIFQHNALVFITKQTSGIIGPYELADKRIMLAGTEQSTMSLKAMLAKADLTPSDYTVVDKEFGVQALIDDRVDALGGYITNQPFALRQQGLAINVINPQSYGIDLYGDILFTSQNELTNHPGRADSFRRASLMGWEYALAHPEELIQLIHTKYQSSASIEHLRYEARETIKLIVPDVIPIGNIDMGRLRALADTYFRLGLSPELSDAALQQFTHGFSVLSLTDGEENWLAEHPVIRVGIDRDFAPYEWIDEKGQYQGVAADYMRLIEAKLGVRFDIVADKPWHEIQAMAERGELDLLSCLNSTPERDVFLGFTAPYVQNPIVIITSKLQSYVGALNNLAGKTVAIERDYFTHENLAANYPDIKLKVVDTTQQALDLVAIGEADAYVGDAAYASYAIKQAGLLNLQFSGQTKDNSVYRIGVNKAHPQLLSMVSKALNAISRNERKEINDRWADFTVNTGIAAETIYKMAAIVLLLLLLAAVRMYLLRQSKRLLQQRESRLNLILDSLPIPCAIHNKEGILLSVNQSLVDTFGYTIDDIPTLDVWWSKAYPDEGYRSEVQTRWKNHLSKKQEMPRERKIRCFNGRVKYVIVKAISVSTETGEVNIVTFVDITERKKAEEALVLSGRVFNEAREGIIITAADGNIVDVNPAFTEITGYSRSEVIGEDPKILSSGQHDSDFYQQMWQEIHTAGYWQGEIWNRKKNGEIFAELLSVSTLLDEQGNINNYLGLFSDITDSKNQQQALEMMAHYDVLTNLPNRTLLADRFSQAIAHSNRSQTILAVCFLDLDNFKLINDSHGHGVGDQLLIEVASRILKNIRAEDTASRQGGDEFALLLGGLESLEQCQQMMERLHESLAQPYLIEGQEYRISASSGITLFPDDEADLDTLLRHADQAMYKAKLAGRNCYRIFNAEEDQQAIQKQGYLQEIEQGLIKNEFRLYYQPKVNMKTGVVFGVEALIRWQHPEKGLVPPLDFLPAIENTALEIEIGAWVIDEAFKQSALWRAQNIDLQVSVNISSNHLLSPLFLRQLDQGLAQHNTVSAGDFQLEILESSALGDIDAISNIINICQQELGISVALDDFGTGYSSLAHLRHLSASTIKIDQTFVRDLLDDPSDYAIIDGVIGLARSFDRNVIAEGVETDEHGLMLLIMGCEQAQGYGIARPMPAQDIPGWLKAYTPKGQWIKWADSPRTRQEQKLKLFRITADHWLKRFEETLWADKENIDDTLSPVIKNGCQKAWISRARHERLFEENWLNELGQIDDDLKDYANKLIEQYQAGAIDEARSDFSQLKDLFDQQQSVLDLAEQW